MTIRLTYQRSEGRKEINLPGSKSESNRALLLSALSEEPWVLKNLSVSNDTLLMQRCLALVREQKGKGTELDVEDAGTVARFMLALCAVTPGTWTLKGSTRMQQRPQGPLVQALRSLGAEIISLGKEDRLPLQVTGRSLSGGQVSIDGTQSSQFISALMMIAPTMQEGLSIQFKGEPASRPYLDLTAEMMARGGLRPEIKAGGIRILPGRYSGASVKIGADWSAASFFYAFTALSSQELLLRNLDLNSLQGDRFCARIFRYLGVESEALEEGCLIRKKELPVPPKPFILNLNRYPDLAPNIIMACALKGLEVQYHGLETLALKESDRVDVLGRGLGQFGIKPRHMEHTWQWSGIFQQAVNPVLHPESDHRMAMAFALLALLNGSLSIGESECVRKSFPTFWQEAAKIGFKTLQE